MKINKKLLAIAKNQLKVELALEDSNLSLAKKKMFQKTLRITIPQKVRALGYDADGTDYVAALDAARQHATEKPMGYLAKAKMDIIQRRGIFA